VAVTGGCQATLDLSLRKVTLVTSSHGRGLFSWAHSRKGNVLIVPVRVAPLERLENIGVSLALVGKWRRWADLVDELDAVLLVIARTIHHIVLLC
jgi:hypothetical protein